jgi:N4-gp56 family major capsid protein
MTQRIYGDGTNSTIGATQLQTYYYQKKALIDLKKEQYFGPLASVTGMPKHFGKTIKRYHYLPMLDDRNVNDQGIDAAGAIMASTEFAVRLPALVNTIPVNTEAAEAAFTAAHSSGDIIYITDSTQWLLLTADTAIGYDASTTGGASGTEKSDAEIKAYIEADTAGVTATVVNNSITVDMQDLVYTTEAAANIVLNIIAGSTKAARYGNLYGSSKDVGTIAGKLPALSEVGGRVNRVGFKRIELEGTFEKFGFFDEYTQESLDFDTDAQLEEHVNREMLRGANEMTEDAIQIDLLNGAGVHRYAGTATAKSGISGATGAVCEVTYADLSALSIELDNNRCPKDTKILSGTRMVDTRVIPACRAMLIGSEMIPTIERMTDHFSNQAFIPLAQYAAGTKALNGEIGTVGHFRIVVVPEMMHWAGVGAAEGSNAGYQATNGRYNVYPMLVVGSESFTTIGFQTNGKSTKFKIFHKKPGYATADRTDPYGETGFMSIKWYYGMMMLRTEYLALVYSVGRI